ncbi:Serine arginine-rich splicing factor 2 [Sarracenia purpurea var. burkii]
MLVEQEEDRINLYGHLRMSGPYERSAGGHGGHRLVEGKLVQTGLRVGSSVVAAGSSECRAEKDIACRVSYTLQTKGELNNVKVVQHRKGLHSDAGRQRHSIFVDQLPERMDHRWLGQLFAQCGTILDVYIPQKRRLVSNSKFGFVRFKEVSTVEKAISMYHGIWCVNKRLIVKHAKVSKWSGRKRELGPFPKRGQNTIPPHTTRFEFLDQNHLPDMVAMSTRKPPNGFVLWKLSLLMKNGSSLVLWPSLKCTLYQILFRKL